MGVHESMGEIGEQAHSLVHFGQQCPIVIYRTVVEDVAKIQYIGCIHEDVVRVAYSMRQRYGLASYWQGICRTKDRLGAWGTRTENSFSTILATSIPFTLLS